MYKKLLFCTDGSSNSMCAQREALKLAKENSAELFVLMVVDLTDEFEALAPGLTEKLERQARDIVDNIAAAAKAEGVKTEAIVKEGEPNKKILEVAREKGVDAIMLGTHGRKGFMNTVMGSITRKVIAEAFVPVIVIHSKYCAL